LKISGYRIEKQIGQGGMASVYLAIQESLDRPVALKILSPDYSDSPEFSKRFLNEGRILASLRHSNIITIHDIGIEDGMHFISMEYVEGNDLKSQLRAGINPSTSLNYVETIADCLQVAHKRNIVHRDVKPANVMFREDGTLLLTDFGIAKQLGGTSDLTVTGSTLGTPHYLSPEQAQAKPLDGRADIYSLGIMLYEMLVGKKPYQGDSDINTVLKHITEPVPTLPDHLKAFQPLLDKMIAKAPSDRFSDVAELIDAIRAFRSDEQGLISKLDALGAGSASLYEAPTKPLSAQGDTTPIAATVQTESVVTRKLSAEPPVAEADDTPVAVAPEQIAPPASAPSAVQEIGHDEPTKILAPRRKKRTGPFLFLGGVAVLTVLAIVGIDFWMTRALDRPASVPRIEKRVEPVKQVINTPASSPANISSAQKNAQATEQTRLTPEPSSVSAPVVEKSTRSAKQSTVTPESSAMASTEPSLAEQIAARKKREKTTSALLKLADIAVEDFRLTKPDDDNALNYYQMVLEIDPENEQAKAGPARIADKYAELARSQMNRRQYAKADEYIDKGLEIDSANSELIALRARVAESKASPPRKKSYREDTPKELYDRVKKFFD
jgi:serine/threonine-protein kinase PpkA